MSRWKLIVFVGIVIATGIAMPQTSSAQAASVSREIRIQARVLPTHTVIIDRDGTIQEIISNNTDANANVKVYVDTVSKMNEQVMNPQIMQQYKTTMRTAPKRVGTIYREVTLPTVSLLQPTLQNRKSQPLNPIALAVISR